MLPTRPTTPATLRRDPRTGLFYYAARLRDTLKNAR